MKKLKVFILRLDGMLVHHISGIIFASNHLYTWVESGTVKIKYLA